MPPAGAPQPVQDHGPPPALPPRHAPATGPGGGPGNLFDGRPRRLHPSSPVLDLVLSLRQWGPLVVILLVGSGFQMLPVIVLGAAAVIGWRFLAWTRFSYRIDGDAVRVEQGVLNRERREVPIRRIQQVDLQRKLRHRALGVAVLRIDTAGGGSGAEIALEAIGDDEAMALRQALLVAAERARGGPDAAAGRTARSVAGDGTDTDGESGGPGDGLGRGPTTPHVLAELETRDLVLAGVTGSRLGAALPLVAATIGLMAELPAQVAGSISEAIGDTAPTATILIPLLLLLAVPVVLLFAAGSSIMTDHGFTLVRLGNDLHLRRGLLDQREATLSLHRIQVVRIYDNPVRRRLGLVSVQLQSAGSGSASDGDVTRLTVPLVRLGDLDGVLAEILPGALPRPELLPAPRKARRRVWIRRVTPVALVVAVVVLATWSWWSLVLLAALVPAGFIAEQAFRGLGHAATPTFVFARRGGIFRETVVVPVAKTQSSRVRSSPFQRRVGLATLLLGVAGRGRTPAVVDGDVERLRVLRHTALYTHAARADEEAVRRRTRGTAEALAEDDPVPVDA